MDRLEKDVSRGIRQPILILVFKEEDGEEPIATFAERGMVPIPERGDTVEITGGTVSGENAVEEETVGEYTISEISYEYSLLEPAEDIREELDEEQPDMTFISVEITVNPTESQD